MPTSRSQRPTDLEPREQGISRETYEIWSGNLSKKNFERLWTLHGEDFLCYFDFALGTLVTTHSNFRNLVAKKMVLMMRNNEGTISKDYVNFDHDAVNNFVKCIIMCISKGDNGPVAFSPDIDWLYYFYLSVSDLVDKSDIRFKYTKAMLQFKKRNKNAKFPSERPEFGPIEQQIIFGLLHPTKLSNRIEKLLGSAIEPKLLGEGVLEHISIYLLCYGKVLAEAFAHYSKSDKIKDDELLTKLCFSSVQALRKFKGDIDLKKLANWRRLEWRKLRTNYYNSEEVPMVSEILSVKTKRKNRGNESKK